MPHFTYTACDLRQNKVAGSITAVSRQAATKRLQGEGLRPVRLSEVDNVSTQSTNRDIAPGNRTPQKLGFTARDRLPFLKALTALVESGYPTGEALRLLPNRLRDRKLKALSHALWERLRAGATFSKALEEFPATFDPQMISLIQAGEATGNLREVLKRLIVHYTSVQELRRKLVTAVCYPAFIGVTAMSVLIFFALFLMPRLQGLLNSLGGTLPWSTRMLLSVSRGLVLYGPFVATGVILGGVALWQWTRKGRGRILWDDTLLRLPVIGGLVIDTCVQTFCQTLAILVENGVPTVEALRIAARTVPNQTLRRQLQNASDAVVDGQGLGRALSQIPELPLAMIDRFNLAENTGTLSPHLRELSVEVEDYLAYRLKSMTDLASTGMLLVAFSFVGFVAYAIVSAVFQVSASFKF